MQPSANGSTPNGTGKIYPFTFKDSGYTIHIRRLNPLLLRDIQKNFPPPKPPQNKVMWGDEERWEENPSDPDYLAALESHNLEVNEKIIRLMLRRATIVDMTPDRLAEVDQIRREMLEDLSMELDSDPKIVWLMHVAVGSAEDLAALSEAVFRKSQPTEAAIEEAVETFRS